MQSTALRLVVGAKPLLRILTNADVQATAGCAPEHMDKIALAGNAARKMPLHKKEEGPHTQRMRPKLVAGGGFEPPTFGL